MATSAALVSRLDKPPRSTNAFAFSPTGGQPSSAIRSRAKFKMIKKADEKEAPLRAAWSFMFSGSGLIEKVYLNDHNKTGNNVSRGSGITPTVRHPSCHEAGRQGPCPPAQIPHDLNLSRCASFNSLSRSAA